jgi:hypothetical protein
LLIFLQREKEHWSRLQVAGGKLADAHFRLADRWGVAVDFPAPNIPSHSFFRLQQHMQPGRKAIFAGGDNQRRIQKTGQRDQGVLPPSLNISPAQLRPKRRFETKQ